MTSIDEFVFDPARPRPEFSEEGEPFWRYLQAGELRIQYCTACETPRHPPQLPCPVCGSTDSEWRLVPTTGSVYTYTTVYRAPTEAFRRFVPYVLAVVEMDGSGVRILGNILGPASEDVHIGQRVSLAIDEIDPELSLFHFVVDGAESRDDASAV